MGHEHRDRAYIRKDILVMLTERGEVNQTRLLSYCGLNLKRHKEIIDELERKNLIEKNVIPWGNKSITKYKISSKGLDFCKMILDPYESMFPRAKNGDDSDGWRFKQRAGSRV